LNWPAANLRQSEPIRLQPTALAFSLKNVNRSDIQPRMEACGECDSFPHISQGQIPV
jgi:hypothetical protein